MAPFFTAGRPQLSVVNGRQSGQNKGCIQILLPPSLSRPSFCCTRDQLPDLKNGILFLSGHLTTLLIHFSEEEEREREKRKQQQQEKHSFIFLSLSPFSHVQDSGWFQEAGSEFSRQEGGEREEEGAPLSKWLPLRCTHSLTRKKREEGRTEVVKRVIFATQ